MELAGKIIGWIVSFGCAALFFSIGQIAEKREKPMWFWSGKEVDPAEITDVKAYNRENGRMWKLYSLWYVAAGIACIWSDMVYLIIDISAVTIGLGILVRQYKKIYNKYKALPEENITASQVDKKM